MKAPVNRDRLPDVAFQGERGAFSEEAARKLLGDEIAFLPCQRFDDVFRSLKSGKADAAVIPIENTLHGSVHENYDHLLHYELPIAGETNVRIVHNLIARPGVSFAKIKRVYSHPVALNQCLDFFERNPQIEKVSFYDTAGSVKMLMEESLADAGAIASAVAAETYGARILRRSIEDDRRNFTRFFLLRQPAFLKRFPMPDNSKTQWKTSLVFTTRNAPGALFRCLSAFALRDLNLMKIESRPLRGKPWEYLFYLDFLDRVDAPNAQNAIGHLRELADLLHILGCYPRGQ
ncbi:MAG: prephenate dehydratase [Acidobacteriota bacterium]|nr:prephenate dehydratase [Acidobacteriota bacterium]